MDHDRNGSRRTACFMNGGIVKIDSNLVKGMKDIVSYNYGNSRYRICLHDNPDNPQQEMLICTKYGDYSRPHKHIGQTETHTIIEGREQVWLFDDDGNIIDSFILDRENGVLTYRINDEIYHTSTPITEFVIKLETKRGPFKPDSNIYAPWAPDGSDSRAAEAFLDMLLKDS